VVSSDNPTPQAFIDKARSLGLQGLATLSFPTMARAPDAQGGASKLVALKAVPPGYPLRGSLQVAQQAGCSRHSDARRSAARRGLGRRALAGHAGIEDRRYPAAGDESLRISRVIVLEPDRGTGFVNFAPRVMINEADLRPAASSSRPAGSVTGLRWPGPTRK